MAFADNEKIRYVDRILSIGLRIASEQKPGTVTRPWIANFLKRSERWISATWKKNPYEVEMKKEHIGKAGVLSQESKEILKEMIGKEKKSLRQMASELESVRDKPRNHMTIMRHLRSIGAKPYHEIPKPRLSELNREDRLSFCELLRDWDANDFMHLAPSDEFFIYADRRPNYQNDRIWALSLDDIEGEIRFREKSKHSVCIGVFICFTAKTMMWVTKEKGQSWDGTYFREQILVKHVIPFLKNENNVLSVDEVTFLQDKAPCFKAIATQQLLKSNNIDFFDNSQWPGSSPDLNATENLGAILKKHVEDRILKIPSMERNSVETLKTIISEELIKIKEEPEIFANLLKSYTARLDAVRKNHGGHTDY